ncbi:MAG TPA: hypothetical protein VEO75_06045 [Nitrososphaerales archaeon]|nr:hypothetical protein [Nitrososphaerales archaeon]
MALLLLLSGATAAFADENGHQNGHQDQTQALNATMAGGVANFGSQFYYVSGGQVAFAMIAGQPVDPASATIQYSFFASQNGLSTQGFAKVQFSGTTTTGDSVSLSGTFNINGMVPAVQFPQGCTTNCQSALPFFFLASSPNVQLTVGTSTQTVAETLQIESPYFNPWGAPIVLASTDNSMVIAATYTKGSILWAGTTLVGTIAGTLDATAASGLFSMTNIEYENMVTGTASDSGSVTYSSMTPSSLNAKGHYSGTSTIPTAGTSDCSAVTGIPGTCTATGFQSAGGFTFTGDANPSIKGTYSTTWGSSALSFVSSVSATVSQDNGSHQGH